MPIFVVIVHAFIGRAPLWLIVLAGIVVALVTATLMHRFIEIPAINLGKRFARSDDIHRAQHPRSTASHEAAALADRKPKGWCTIGHERGRASAPCPLITATSSASHNHA